MAREKQRSSIQFISVCCDSFDGAIGIIDKGTSLRWQHVSHYFMEPNDKEEAKQVLGFASVPFYVVINREGIIEQKGGARKID